MTKKLIIEPFMYSYIIDKPESFIGIGKPLMEKIRNVDNVIDRQYGDFILTCDSRGRVLEKKLTDKDGKTFAIINKRVDTMYFKLLLQIKEYIEETQEVTDSKMPE